MNRKKTVKSIEITEKTIKTTLKRAILSEGANINKDEFTKKNIPSIKSKIFIACLMLTMVVFSGCNNLTSSVSPTFNKNETEKKNPAYEENISLNEYYCSENGYSLVFYRYDADKQEVDLIFDSNCLVKLYDVYYDDSFNGDKNIEYYTGYVDKNEKNQFEIIYDRVANQYSVFAGIGGEKIYFDQKWYTGNYVFNQAKTTNHSQIELLTPSSYSFQMNSYGEPSTATDFGEYSHDTVFNIIPNSFELYGRMSLDKTSYVGTHGDVPFDPYRLSVTLKTKKDNIYFIQKIYMDVLVFDEYGETIKEYHNEYNWKNVEDNLKKLEALGFDNSNPATNEEYNIIENWEDFPPNAYSSIVLLSFDIFSNREHTYARAGEDGFSITVPAYEVRYVGPQVFDSFININNGKLFEHR